MAYLKALKTLKTLKTFYFFLNLFLMLFFTMTNDYLKLHTVPLIFLKQ